MQLYWYYIYIVYLDVQVLVIVWAKGHYLRYSPCDVKRLRVPAEACHKCCVWDTAKVVSTLSMANVVQRRFLDRPLNIWNCLFITDSAYMAFLGNWIKLKPILITSSMVSLTPSLSLMLRSAPSLTRPSIVYSLPSSAAVCRDVCWEWEREFRTVVSAIVSDNYIVNS